MTDEAIRFHAQIVKIQTMTDGGYRLSLDLSESDLPAITSLLEAKQPGMLLAIAAVAVQADARPSE